jgi:hypothetical protein
LLEATKYKSVFLSSLDEEDAFFVCIGNSSEYLTSLKFQNRKFMFVYYWENSFFALIFKKMAIYIGLSQ